VQRRERAQKLTKDPELRQQGEGGGDSSQFLETP